MDEEHRARSSDGTDEWVSASDIAAYAYCARAYWLERVQRVDRPLHASERLEAGGRHHRAHGRRVRLQYWLIRLAILLALAAAALFWAGLRG